MGFGKFSSVELSNLTKHVTIDASSLPICQIIPMQRLARQWQRWAYVDRFAGHQQMA